MLLIVGVWLSLDLLGDFAADCASYYSNIVEKRHRTRHFPQSSMHLYDGHQGSRFAPAIADFATVRPSAFSIGR